MKYSWEEIVTMSINCVILYALLFILNTCTSYFHK